MDVATCHQISPNETCEPGLVELIGTTLHRYALHYPFVVRHYHRRMLVVFHEMVLQRHWKSSCRYITSRLNRVELAALFSSGRYNC